MRSKAFWIAISLALMGASHGVCGGLTLMDACYRDDVRFPQFDRFWGATSEVEGSSPSGELGGVLYVYVRNTAGKPLTVNDVRMEGVSLRKAVAYSDARKYRKFIYAASIYFSKLPQAHIDTLKKAGEPIWWRFQPKTLKPGECGELIVRLRHKPAGSIVKLGLPGLDVKVPVGAKTPRFQAICFAPSRAVVYLYTQHPKGGIAPVKITMDGVDITSGATMASDPKTAIVPVICKLKSPVAPASLHCFQAVYRDGGKATASIKAFDSEFALGMWGYRPGEADQLDIARFHLEDLAAHNINVQMEMAGSAAAQEFLKSAEGHALMKSLAIRRMMYEPGKGGLKDAWAFFLADEPDAGDSRVPGVPAKSKIGALAQGLSERQDVLHETHPLTPGFLNIDFTLRPQNWYVYGQAPDILASDPYYQARLYQEAENGKSPEKISAFKKATYIEGVTAICRSSHAPKPVHLILLAGGGTAPELGGAKFAPPQIKRIETYYSIGAGAKGISYWWFYGLEKGLPPNTPDPAAVAQWREIGLLGAELRTAGPVIATSCAASVPVTAPPQVWARTLLRGKDTLVLLLVNDDYSCDMKGINIKPLKDVEVGVDLPSWLEPEEVFELSSGGTSDVSADASGGRVSLQLGTLDVTRMIFITSDPNLRPNLQRIYDSKFAPNAAKLSANP